MPVSRKSLKRLDFHTRDLQVIRGNDKNNAGMKKIFGNNNIVPYDNVKLGNDKILVFYVCTNVARV